jgi:hypothetical protein
MISAKAVLCKARKTDSLARAAMLTATIVSTTLSKSAVVDKILEYDASSQLGICSAQQTKDVCNDAWHPQAARKVLD